MFKNTLGSNMFEMSRDSALDVDFLKALNVSDYAQDMCTRYEVASYTLHTFASSTLESSVHRICLTAWPIRQRTQRACQTQTLSQLYIRCVWYGIGYHTGHTLREHVKYTLWLQMH
jgi:hypothetical protein